MKALKEGNRYRRRREAYGRREKRARETGFPRWRETGKTGKMLKTIDESTRGRVLVQEEARSLRKPGEECAGTRRNRKQF